MRGAGYLPGAIRELGQQARRGLSPFIGSKSLTLEGDISIQLLQTSEATGVSEWIEQHIHPLSNRLIHHPDMAIKELHQRYTSAIMSRLTEVMSIADQLSKVISCSKLFCLVSCPSFSHH